MTGFGRAQSENDKWTIICEIKALNGRYFEADIRLPKYLNELDSKLRRALSEYLERGTITVTYNIKTNDAPSKISVNTDLAKEYLEALNHLGGTLGLELSDPMREILKVPDVMGVGEREISDEFKEEIIKITLDAAGKLDEFRMV